MKKTKGRKTMKMTNETLLRLAEQSGCDMYHAVAALGILIYCEIHGEI